MIVGAIPNATWTMPLVTLWPKKQPFVQESAAVMLTSLFRSTSPFRDDDRGLPAKPHPASDPRMSAPSVASPRPMSTVWPMKPKVQSSPSESTFPPIVDQAKSETKTPGLSGFVAL